MIDHIQIHSNDDKMHIFHNDKNIFLNENIVQ